MRDPKEHAARRKLFARPFSKSELRRTWEPAVREKVQLAVSQIQRELKAVGKSDLLKWWTFLATDVSGQLMFGESFNMLQLGKVSRIHICVLHRPVTNVLEKPIHKCAGIHHDGLWNRSGASVGGVARSSHSSFILSEHVPCD